MDEKKPEIVAGDTMTAKRPGQIYALLVCFLLLSASNAYIFVFHGIWDWSTQYLILSVLMILIPLLIIILLFVPRGWAYVAIWLAYLPVGLCGLVPMLFLLLTANPMVLFLLFYSVMTIYALVCSPVHIYFCGY